MSDLISRKALIDDIKSRGYINKALAEIFETVIDDQQSAYDVDKVVEQLEEQQNKNRYENCRDDWNVGLDQAIEIIQRGGAE